MANETDASGNVSYRAHHHARARTQATQVAEASRNAQSTPLSGRASASTSTLPISPIRPLGSTPPPVWVRPPILRGVTAYVAESTPPTESAPPAEGKRSTSPKAPTGEIGPPPVLSRTQAMVQEARANADSVSSQPPRPSNNLPAPPNAPTRTRRAVVAPSSTKAPFPAPKRYKTRYQNRLEQEKAKAFIPITVRYQPYPAPQTMPAVQPSLQALHFPYPGISLAFSDGEYESNSFVQPLPGPSAECLAHKDTIENITHVIRIAKFTSEKAKEDYYRKKPDRKACQPFKPSSSWSDHDALTDVATFNLIVPASKRAQVPVFNEEFKGARDDCGPGGRRLGDSQLLHVMDFLQLALPDAPEWKMKDYAGVSDPVHILITAPLPFPRPPLDSSASQTQGASRRKTGRNARRTADSNPYLRKDSQRRSPLRSQSATDLAAVSRLGKNIDLEHLHDAISRLEDMYWSSTALES